MKRKIFKKRKLINPQIILLAGLFITVATGGFFAFPHIQRFFGNLLDKATEISGFNIKTIDIVGASPKVADIIRKNIQISEGQSIFKKPIDDLYRDVKSISWVKSAIVQKNLPNVIRIKIVEAVPIAVYQHDSKSFLIDKDGTLIEEITEKPDGLSLISGPNANKKAEEILRTISKFEDIKERLETLSFIRERRWDMTISGMKIKLPEKNVEEALNVLSILLKSGKINKNTVNSVDLRIPENVIINGLKIKKTPSV